MNDEELIESLESRLESNLGEIDYNGPQRVFGTAIVTVLIELAMKVLSGCFNSDAAEQLKSNRGVTRWQKIRLKRELRHNVYNGSRRDYKDQEGDKVLASLVKTLEETSDEEADAMKSYVEETQRQRGD